MRRANKAERAKNWHKLTSGEFSIEQGALTICETCTGLVEACFVCGAYIDNEPIEYLCGDGSTKRDPQHICMKCAEEEGILDDTGY